MTRQQASWFDAWRRTTV